MILSRRRPAPILGALAALVVGALVGYAVFGIHGIDVVAALNRDAAFVSTDSFATRDRPPVRQARRVPRRPRPAQGGARADRCCTCCGAPGAAMTGWPPPAGRCWRSRSRAPGCSPGTSCGRCRSRSSRATAACWSRRSFVQALFIVHQTSPAVRPRAMSEAATASQRTAWSGGCPAGCARAIGGAGGIGAHAAGRDDPAGARGPAAGDRHGQRRRAPDARQPAPDRRRAHVARLHRPRLPQPLDRAAAARRKQPARGGLRQHEPRARRRTRTQLCLGSGGPSVDGRRTVHGGWYLPAKAEDRARRPLRLLRAAHHRECVRR